MDIIIIGSGNVAYHLAKAFSEKQIIVKQLFGRNERKLSELSEKLQIQYSTEKLEDADLYLICVSDSAVADMSAKINRKNCIVAHTAGSLPTDVLKGEYRKACFYPLQTFSKNKVLNYAEIPFFIETESPADCNLLEDLAHRVSTRVLRVTFETRKYIHLTAVFTCNFTNHLFARAKEIADKQGIPFEYFLPLIRETTEKISFLNPRDAQTGPAIRGDEAVLKMHQKLLSGSPLDIYKTMNTSIKEMYEL